MYINIHTHIADKSEEELSILNLAPNQTIPYPSKHYSIGIHPWNVNAQSENELNTLLSKAQEKQIIAIGEIGLDKLTAQNFSLQLSLFQSQIEIANRLNLPIIIHCVKAYNELLALKSIIKTPAIIHSFRGKPQLMESLCNAGFYLSFGDKFNAESLRSVPINHLFLETDDAATSIQTIYLKVAETRGIPIIDLTQSIEKNFRTLFPTIHN